MPKTKFYSNKITVINDTLLVSKLTFYTNNDKEAFFNWLDQMGCIEHYKYANKEIFLEPVSTDLHDNDLRDMIGLFYRYDMDMKGLKVFLNNENKKWFFDNKKTYWYKNVFGK